MPGYVHAQLLYACLGGCVHLRPVSGRSGVGSAHWTADGVAQQGAVLRPSGRPHVRDPDRTARSQVLPVPGLQEAEPHRPQLYHVPAAAHHSEPRPLDPARRRRSLRHQVDRTSGSVTVTPSTARGLFRCSFFGFSC